VISPEDVIKYANKSAALRTKSGFFKKGKREETPLAWEKFLYPYYDVKMEITLKEIEKLGSKYRSMTKVIKSRACIDGKTGAIVDGTKDGISYRYSFLKDLSADETAFLYYIHQIDDVLLHELSGLGFSVEKLMTISDKLASKGYLKKSGTKKPRYKISKGVELPNPTKLNCIMEDHVATESSSTDRVIRPDITAASLPIQLAKYWNHCNIPSSTLVYYPYYGITYDRKDYYRIEVIDGLTGQRQESLEHIVSVRPQNKITKNQTTNQTK